MPMKLMFFPDEVIELSREVLLHPDLQERLEQHPSSEWEIRFAEIGSFLGVAMDDVFDEQLIKQYAGQFLDMLRSRRTGIITSIPVREGGKGIISG